MDSFSLNRDYCIQLSIPAGERHVGQRWQVASRNAELNTYTEKSFKLLLAMD